MKQRLAILILACAPHILCGATNAPVVINVGVCIQEPFAQVSSKGTVEGFFRDILSVIASRNGWEIRYVPDSPIRNLARLEQGALDLVMPVAWSEAGSRRYRFTSQGLISSQGELYVPESTTLPSLSDLSGKMVAVVLNDPHYAAFSDMLDEAHVQCEFVELGSYRQALESLDRRRVDAALVDRYFGEQAAGQYRIASARITSPMVDFRLVAPRVRNRDLITAIDEGQAALKSDPHSLYYRSLNRWVLRGGRNLPGVIVGLLAFAGLAGGGMYALLLLRRSAAAEAARLTTVCTELRRTLEEENRQARQTGSQRDWYADLLNHTDDLILVHGVDDKLAPLKFAEVNRAACLRLGYSRDELLALSPADIETAPAAVTRPVYHDLLRHWSPRHAAAVESPAEETEPLSPLNTECTYRSKSGAEIPMEVTIRILEHEGRPVVVYSAHDISTRRKTQVALQESERRFYDFFARSPIGIALYDASRRLTEVNQSALGMIGVSDRPHFIHLDLFAPPHLHPEALTTLLKGGTVRHELVLDFDAMKANGGFQTTRTGRCHFDILMTNLGLDLDFNPKGFLVMLQDITEHRRAEEALRQNERLLRQANKMEAIGTLAGGIAHDFNNILTPIIGYTEMALLSCPPQDPVRANLDEVLKASHRAKELVKQILVFSRQTEHEEKPIRLSQIIREVIALLRGSIMPGVELRCDLQTDRDIVRADPTQLHQVLMNLSMNALHAMRDTGGTLEISLRLAALDGRTRGAVARMPRGTYVDLAVRDTGIGMDRATMDRIFEPFFTTKPSGEGTGMGLAVVHGIITSLMGTVTVESEPGKGSTFHILLPLLERATETSSVADEPIPHGVERVLFVDDENDIVAMAGQMLRSLGYQPVTFQQSQEALACFRAHPDSFDLLITDQVMPVLTGMELVREIHRIRPDLPVLLCTGFSKMVSDKDVLEGGVSEILMKPIVRRQFAEAIRRVLQRQARGA